MTPLGRAAHQLGDFPRLSCTMAQVRVVRLALVRSMQMGAKYLSDVALTGTESNLSACHSFPHVPVTTEERCRSSIEGITNHARFLDGPF